jgi:hypothetical protein
VQLFFVLYTISSNIGTHYGTGRHHRDLDIEEVENARHCWWFCYLFYTWSMIFSKLSIGWLLLRISIRRIHSWIIYAAMFTSVVAGITFFFVIIFQCNPVSFFWQRRTQSGTCIPNIAIVGLGYVYSTFSIISDFTFAIIPAFLVWHLQLKRRAKLALIPLITMGCMYVNLPLFIFITDYILVQALQSSHGYHSFIISIRLTSYVGDSSQYRNAGLIHSGDTLDIAIWSTVEMGLAITAGSLATLRPLFFLAVHRLGLSTQPSDQRYAASGPRASKADKLRPDIYKLSASVHTQGSAKDTSSTPHWFRPQLPTKELKKMPKPGGEGADNESQKSLNERSSDEEDGMHIMVSKTFYITDEGRSIVSRGNSVA